MKRALPVLVAVAAAIASIARVQTAPAPAGTVPTFAKDVAPIMFEKCTSCHRAGEVAPMTFLSYEDVRPWAKVIRGKVVAREMPPWGADPDHSLKMRNDRSLSKQQIDTIVAWVDGGAPKGSDADMPPMPKFAEGWTFGREPDYVLEMPVEAQIPAEGELGVQMFYTRRCHGRKIGSPKCSRFVPATARSCITPACSSSIFRRARRLSTAA